MVISIFLTRGFREEVFDNLRVRLSLGNGKGKVVPGKKAKLSL
jgi:hypothetical protein